MKDRMKTTEHRQEGSSRDSKLKMKHLVKHRTPARNQRMNVKTETDGDSNTPRRMERNPDGLQGKEIVSESVVGSSNDGQTETSGEQRLWHMCQNFAIRPPVSLPFLTGCVLDGRALIRDLWSDELYLTDLANGATEEAFVDQLKGDVFYCATLEDDRMVYCDSKSGLVHICTRAGEHLKTIAITHRPSTHMYHVTVDSNSQIVFGVRDGKIFIIDPQECKIVSSASVECKIEAMTVTPSGYIVVKSGIAKFNVIQNGVIVHTVTDPDWSWAACVSHPFEDILYVAYSRRTDGSTRRIMALRPGGGGGVLEDGVLELSEAPHPLLQPSMTITKNCEIVVSDNGKLVVFRKEP